MPSLPLLLILLTVGERVTAWDNGWDQYLSRECPSGQAVSYISSIHSNRHEDRRWHVACKRAVSFHHCYWSGYVNHFDRVINFNCRTNYVIAGVKSYHSNRDEDRRWSFRCCGTSRMGTYECQETPWVNYWDQFLYWNVPGGNYLTGVYSYHDNGREDRRWRFRYCRAATITRGTRTRSSSLDRKRGIGLIEGDIMVPRSRSATQCSGNRCRWKKTSNVVQVPYTLGNFDVFQRGVITVAMNTFHEKTCIRFVPRSNQRDYLKIISSGWCSSYVGKTGGRQYLKLNVKCIQYSTIHELMHALGFWHEQNRSDRDRYVRINWGNLKKGKEHNFRKKKTNNLNTVYDYFSVMHYHKKAWSRNGKDTITPTAIPSAKLGGSDKMTKTDILKINRLYGCKTSVTTTSRWDNEWDGELRRTCPNGQAVSAIESIHSNSKEDRLWKISCKTFSSTGHWSKCQWSGFVNNYDQYINYRCPAHHVIAGVYSFHNNRDEDRRWKFNCCKAPRFYTFDCRYTNYFNYWDEYFKWPVPGGNFLTGIHSYHSNRHEDRRWGFKYCQGETR